MNARLQALESKVHVLQTTGTSSAADTDFGGRKPALIVGGWGDDTPAEETLNNVKQIWTSPPTRPLCQAKYLWLARKTQASPAGGEVQKTLPHSGGDAQPGGDGVANGDGPGGAQEQIAREERGAANAAHVLRARRHLRHLVPFLLDADAKTAVQKALKELKDWAREYWGPELVEIVEDDGENNTGGRPELRAPLPPQRGVEGRPEPRARRFTSPSPPDQDDKGVRP
eukprot:s2720_g13.t1